MKLKILVTGAAGFIGYHLAKRLANDGWEVIGLDNLNNYYDVKLKLDRLQDAGISSEKIAYNEAVQSERFPNYSFVQLGIEDAANLERLFGRHHFDIVCHLAAQAGVRYSIKHPDAYIQSNIVGFFNILESCRHNGIRHLVFASSSSVYGDNHEGPFREEDMTDAPISFYAATKKSNELMAHTYSHLFQLPATGLRFFTVYGPWGRPDMAYSIFAKAITEGKPVKLFNDGKLSRDFTYVDDIVEGMVRILEQGPVQREKQNGKPSLYSPTAPFRLYNIGNSQPTSLTDFVGALEVALGMQAKIEYLPMQPGDVESTCADVSELARDYGYKPNTPLREGMQAFVDWFESYFNALVK